MSVRTELLRFLREPAMFAATADDPQIWLDALENFVGPALAQPGQYPLRPAQIVAWQGLANARAGLVLGPPGTGKTHLLAWLILGYMHARVAAGLPCRVYATAFTRNAIGNLLDAVSARRDEAWSAGPEVWFFGNTPEAGVASNVRVQDRLYGDGLDNAFSVLNAPAVVVGGSVWSLYRLLAADRAPNADGLTGELFDLVCIDEASQLVLSHGLLGLAGMKPGGRVVVAGDDRQLPPIRAGRDVTLDNRALGGSLYSFMASAGAPEFRLDETFRLNAPLARFPEAAFYPGEYRSAVPNEVLALRTGWQDGLDDWEQAVIAPDLPLCVILHDGPPAATSNPFEAHLAARFAQLLEPRLETDAFWMDGLAVISPHRAQNASIRSLLPPTLRRGAFVDTVDKIQGKERDAVILTYTVADAEFALAEAEFIFSSERLNVAITRARRKLIVLISRRLLDAVPGDQDLMDKAERLREFVFGCAVIGERTLPDGQGGSVRVQIRARGFQEPAVLADPPSRAEPPLPDLTAAQLAVLAAVRKVALADRRNGAALRALGQALARRDDLLPDLVALHHAGHITLSEPRSGFWVARPLDATRTVYAATIESVRARIAQVVTESRSGPFAPFYWRLRDRFAWMNARGQDILLPILQALALDSVVTIRDSERGLTIDIPATASPQPAAANETLPEVSDDDFEVLNALESAEAHRINFGVFESWTSAATLADEMRRDRTEVSAAIGRLATDGWVLLAEEGRVRSRMAELAREIRYAKQRFAAGDAARRPYVVRSLKVEVRDRDKPHWGQSVGAAFAAVSAGLPREEQHVLEALRQTLVGMWGPKAAIAGFQARGLQSLLAAWSGDGPQSFVIAADTGSGKTEAALLPLITAAAADRLRGVRGVRAVLTYPRTRLAANQAQRLAGYLAALSQQSRMPTVTMGLQFTQVPRTFAVADEAAGWRRQANGVWSFPLFGCPTCDRELLAHEAEGVEGADSLRCTNCGWSYDGWIGTKVGLERTPPNFFLPTTDSLHQWLHAPHYSSLFGDREGWAPPRALLADEIHLYTHIHGAQVGYALRRLAARCARNSGGGTVLAIGMSATLGDPATAWGRLIGREDVVPITPDTAAGERQPNPKGREYYYFVQPEAESRGQDISGASTTVQSFMCLAHGMRRRTGHQGGYRSLVFLDSIDKVRRLHAVYQDAEEIKRLASFRTRFYPDDPVTGQPRTDCCQEPHGCEIFRDGECWWFAANDSRQVGPSGLRRRDWPLTVAPQPVTSATTGRVEELIRRSDVVFATSSLEVGYDDPDISLVYQQYAPQNLASFIQRKGRGGRGVDDRPVTGVTLSLYSARDSWWFRRPSEMVNPRGFDTPLNPNNHFVRRGQVLSAMLDGAARFAAVVGVSPLLPGGRLAPGALAEAETMVREVFQEDVWLEFGAADLEQLWTHALEQARPEHSLETLAQIRIAVGWIQLLVREREPASTAGLNV
ncbi:AAA domain-containing protein [Mesorhizobium sp. M1D.F.Ca.ET.043.01.1.1]|uniref:AAA domain-containing protein n=1 Tax=Mesorhizobium sp. M1D.F.Ca.ET.043.01.1.1 TaxID=2493669 RepID=UPI000F75F3FE|nr:AAA domain-containing protein [Mesorhizobium sp. M1D.F.Ca.ET.043.01.1.1]AZO73511.1 DEAD/DEAH box helicase [Mesorhizobium sp. M1D.F.Ca.ET.043.01.1.1]